MKEVTTIIKFLGREFSCKLWGSATSSEAVRRQQATYLYGLAIQDHIDYGHPLPSEVTEVQTLTATSVTSSAPTSTTSSVPVPPPTQAPSMYRYTVRLMVLKRRFKCFVTSNRELTTLGEKIQEANKQYGNAIYGYINYGTMLPSLVTEEKLGTPATTKPTTTAKQYHYTVWLQIDGHKFKCTFTSPIPNLTAVEKSDTARLRYEMSIRNYLRQATPLPGEVYDEGLTATKTLEMMETGWFTGEPTGEAAKPEGTRDVDKFLREQQDKLWKEML